MDRSCDGCMGGVLVVGMAGVAGGGVGGGPGGNEAVSDHGGEFDGDRNASVLDGNNEGKDGDHGELRPIMYCYAWECCGWRRWAACDMLRSMCGWQHATGGERRIWLWDENWNFLEKSLVSCFAFSLIVVVIVFFGCFPPASLPHQPQREIINEIIIISRLLVVLL